MARLRPKQTFLRCSLHDSATLVAAKIVEPMEQSTMKHDPAVLDEHRGMAAQKATEIRRHLAEVEAQQRALLERQVELEKFLLAAPSLTWADAAEKARYLIILFADTPAGQDPRRQKMIAGVLEDFERLAAEHRDEASAR